MLLLNSSIIGKKILSIREGHPIGEVIGILCQPKNLKIEGFYVRDYSDKKIKVLLSQDIREIYRHDFITNNYESLTMPDELVKHKQIIELSYDLIKKPVKTVSGRKMGKVEDFAFDSESMFILKLYVHQSILKNFNGAIKSIDRGQIVEVNDKEIVVEEPEELVSVAAPATIT